MPQKNTLDFKAQATQMLDILEERLHLGDTESAKQLLVLKFKSLYEIGVAAGRLYEREGIYPYTAFDS
ncbi:MAG: hypothetical protein RLZ35_571 [Pseudomonadota bacterium]|jgi:hypothetical protein